MHLTDQERATLSERVSALLKTLETHDGALPDRDSARDLLFEHVASPALRGHMLAVEAAMAACAARLDGADEAAYRIAGLLHDHDYEKHTTAAEHPIVGCQRLLELGYPSDVIEAILGHATHTGVARTTQMARTLFAVDELTGFLTAVAYVRPGGLEGMNWKSFTKKFKTPSFAAGVNRDEVRQGAEEYGVELREHVLFVADALREAFPAFPNIPEAGG